jgi:uncharacterized protein YjbI with pentapeptide repeats
MIDVEGEPRSLTEMRFAVGLYPCTGCGSRDVGTLELRGGGAVRIYSGPCPRCRTLREVRFRVRREPGTLPSPARFELGGPEASAIIEPVQLVEELDRLGPRVATEPTTLAPAAWRANLELVNRAITCIVELLKFIPAGADGLPDAALDATGRADRKARPEKYQRAQLEGERARYLALVAKHDADAPRIFALEAAVAPRPVARGELSSRTLEAHLQWVKRGRTGDGRLDIAHVDVTGVKVGAKDLSGARLDGVILDRADASFSTFERAELVDVRAVQTNLGSCSFVSARLVRCDLLGANLSLGKLDDAVIGGGRFDRTYLDRGLWRRAKADGASFRDADFGNAALDDAVFVDCDLRGASFSLRTKGILGTTARARFERCDLRDTQWVGRDLDGTVFVDCKFHGTSGQPGRISGVRIERPDLSPAGDGRTIGRDEDVLALWRGATVDLV